MRRQCVKCWNVTTRSYSAKGIKKDRKSHKIAKSGFNYRTAYFQDFDGQYYKIIISVGKNGDIATIYNVGKIKNDALPSAKLIAVVGSQPLGNASKSMLQQNKTDVNTFSKKYSTARDNYLLRMVKE